MEKTKLHLAQQLAACQTACNYCFDACLRVDDIKMMAACIKLDKECAGVCAFMLSMIYSDSDLVARALDMCADACDRCGAECSKHRYEHCQQCAEECEKCARACREYEA